MSGAFAALMKLSQTQTAQSELAVQSQIASHQVQLEKKRREQEARERKEREHEAKLRAKRFEEQRKEEERKLKREEEERAKQQELNKREEEMLNVLKYGPRKAAAASRSSSSRSRGSDKAVDSDGGPGLTREELRGHRNSPDTLTREEKRQRKLAAGLRRSASSATSSSRRKATGATTLLPDGRMVRRLPGGAVDYTTVSRLADPDAAPAPTPSNEGRSARERLAAMPSTLMKLNTVKRDLRTIDEILVDRAKARKAKTLAGDEAKEFSDWFGKGKKKESQPNSQSQPKSSATSSRAVSTAPPSNPGSPAPSVNPFTNSTPTATVKTKPHAPKPSSPFFKSINPKPNGSSRAAPSMSTSASTSKKRPRSPSLSPTPPPPKRRGAMVDIGSEIWSIFGKDKRTYVARDVLSDDEDMEADAASVLKEEQRSARLAQKEDSIALAEERRHEEEKRRRKKERERRERERAA